MNNNSATNSTLTVSGIPENNRLHIGQPAVTLTANDQNHNSVDANWSYDNNVVSIQKVYMYHTHMARLVPIAPGNTVITATYGANSYSFNLTIYTTEIYLSPANHHKAYTMPDGNNTYPISMYSERKNMENIAEHLSNYLSDYFVEVKVTDVHIGDQCEGRADDAAAWFNDKNNGIYLALHSNAGPSDSTDIYSGSVAFHNGLNDTPILAQSLVNSINSLLPDESDRASDIMDASSIFKELRETKSKGIAAIIFEMGYHDNPLEAAYLLSNEETIANAIGQVLVDHFSLPHR